MLSGAYASCGVNHAGQVKGQTYEKSTLNLSVFMASWLNKHFMQQSCSLPARSLVYIHKIAGMVFPIMYQSLHLLFRWICRIAGVFSFKFCPVTTSNH